MAAVTVSKKGWVVIPHEIRQRYGIRPGDRVHVIDYAGRITLIPAAEDPIAAGRGMLKRGRSLTKALLEDRHWELEHEERGLRPPEESQ